MKSSAATCTWSNSSPCARSCHDIARIHARSPHSLGQRLITCPDQSIGRRATQHPWIFREVRSKLDGEGQRAEPTLFERLELCLEHLSAMGEQRGGDRAMRAMRSHYPGYLRQVPHAMELIRELNSLPTFQVTQQVLEGELAACSNPSAPRESPERVRPDGWDRPAPH